MFKIKVLIENGKMPKNMEEEILEAKVNKRERVRRETRHN